MPLIKSSARRQDGVVDHRFFVQRHQTVSRRWRIPSPCRAALCVRESGPPRWCARCAKRGWSRWWRRAGVPPNAAIRLAVGRQFLERVREIVFFILRLDRDLDVRLDAVGGQTFRHCPVLTAAVAMRRYWPFFKRKILADGGFARGGCAQDHGAVAFRATRRRALRRRRRFAGSPARRAAG